MDDIVTGSEDEESVKKLKDGITEILHRGGFNIKDFVTFGDTSTESLAFFGSGRAVALEGA